MYRLLQPGSRFVCKASLGAQLIDTKDYPGVIDSADENCRVSGELHRLDDPATVLARTDAWEGCTPDDPQPHEYERVIRDVKCDDGRCTPAWVYLYRGPVPAG